MTDKAAGPHDHQDAPEGARIFTGQLFRIREGHRWAFTEAAPESPPIPAYRPARVAQMLALAHRLEPGIERGDYRDRADVARQLGFTRARVTQLLDLTLLAPDIQEQILNLEAIGSREPLTERAIREVVAQTSWEAQRRVWDELRELA
jgi:hypothetical protein